MVYGSRGTLIMKTEKEAMLWKEEGRGSEGGGPDQRLWVVSSTRPAARCRSRRLRNVDRPEGSAGNGGDLATNVSRGYTEEMEHFAHCIRTKNFASPRKRAACGAPARRHGGRDHGAHREPRDEAQETDRVQAGMVRLRRSDAVPENDTSILA